ncbi:MULTISPECIES: glutamine--fructose-6-phosphate transaminase (isomerizing) [unclassified Tolypothrix]|uniref:glutamine--fructose-6-phosphate transaminase (isomerizing) n=1 Tax=unclassified Tolypothrix TaxID=2649714 RepID=UPI0005EAAC37|nr:MULTISPECIES: glutamine--fructose-6-phosphate transaminase (isomerizing) [unclassified Tolypothrix]BAY94478.1 D-fructose-6-phosphate amidotransferase [Microchaete diplosiphon NIES-3275]EKE97055.1 glutamine-fructose-6-phosphate transaminase [Tolypothrix sp. PCC 7601]MBE9084371.1 glutamine--fructose-6-phosphate transaminase (isomerizing) [Tolypothrix sp. LEGE 11397]UYD28187.1 glutamine--fructose-6-phosphate transaminase (isomerizing) [Tolypothrix sp. PCC 7712]UYD35936.1 glutamine--fructose-6-
MCGIVGYIGTQAATEILLAGLEKLEYRGYDSAGIATIWEGDVQCVRAKGKLHNLRSKLEQLETPAQIGIGHTRWATHGKPEEYNAHPHLDTAMRVAVVQNGIIENYRELREELKSKGHQFRSETDTEVIPHLIAEIIKKSPASLLEAVRQAVSHLEGAFALAVISADYPDELIVVRQQAPLVIGFGQGEFFCASDTPAIVAYTRAVLPLDNGEIARLTPLGVEVYNFAGDRLKKQPRLLNLNPTMVEKQGFKHFMLKEIYEQPGVVRASLEAYFNNDAHATGASQSPINLGLSESFYADIEQIQIVACGTSWHAALVGKYLLEQLAGISTQVHYASEYRYAPSPLIANTLIIGVTQSGETADTLAALAMEKERRQGKEAKYQARLLGITNRPESSLGHLVPHIINTLAGIEIGVAATKTFVAQLMAFYALALDLAAHRQSISPDKIAEIIEGLRQIPKEIEATLETQESLTEQLAHQFAETQDFIFLGRGINFPIALEGALKLKEISYIHAEGYPAGEMKHGPIALLDAKVPVVAIAVPGSVYEKVISNAQEAKARDSRLIGVTPVKDGEAGEIFNDLLPVPIVDELLSPLVCVVPLQLLAYHIAARRGLDVDQPRNLAKSVTVE